MNNTSTAEKTGTLLASDWSRMGCGLSVRFTYHAERIVADWIPRLPTARDRRRTEPRYFAARHRFLDYVSGRIGKPIVVVTGCPS